MQTKEENPYCAEREKLLNPHFPVVEGKNPGESDDGNQLVLLLSPNIYR